MGFARRFANHKRPNLLLHDPERLILLCFSNPQQPAQLGPGRKGSSQTTRTSADPAMERFIRRRDVRDRVVFLSDLRHAADTGTGSGRRPVINTTAASIGGLRKSGMKVLVNGGLNLSELERAGGRKRIPLRSVGHRRRQRARRKIPAWDTAEADELYSVLERPGHPGVL